MFGGSYVVRSADVFHYQICNALFIRQIVKFCVVLIFFNRTGVFLFSRSLRSNFLILQFESDVAELRMVGDDNRSGCFVARLDNSCRVEFQKELTLFNFVTCFGFRTETLTVKFDGVHADVNQKLHAVIRF